MAAAVPRWHGLRSAPGDPPPAAVANSALAHPRKQPPPRPPVSRDPIFTRELAEKQTSVGERHMARL